MNWFSNNAGTVVGWAITATFTILALARNLWLTQRIDKRLETFETAFLSHLQSQTLHRTPDSEQRIARIEEDVTRLHKGGVK